ncbi:hypothetical protein ACX40Y_15110 [Sphingomonas sp. RS6]
MKISPTKVSRIALAAVLLAGVGVPALGRQQQKAPESLLPPGFDQPAPAPSRPAATPRPQPTVPPQTEPAPVAAPAVTAAEDGGDSVEAVDGNVSAAELPQVDLSQYDLPPSARRSLGRIGSTAWGNAPFAANAFGDTHGRMLQTLMRRLDAPVASRWVTIALRRALMSPIDTPRDVNGADFAAQRAWLLLRMGEAVAARAVIAGVDVDRATPLLDQVIMRVALATGDPAGVCPVADKAAQAIDRREWALARAMCAGLAGKPGEADRLMDAARQGTSQGSIDNLLAEKVIGMGAESRRAVTIEWAGVPRLSEWRFGLAAATGVAVPDDLYRTVGPEYRYWQALAPGVSPAVRAPAAELAAAAGVFSNAGLVDLYADLDQAGDASGPLAETIRDLRNAYAAPAPADRVRAIRALWDAAETPRARYGRLVMTAKAASWIPASKDVDSADGLIASMLSAGYDGAALQWRGVVASGSEGWGLLALADPSRAAVSFAAFDQFRGAASPRKAAMLLAGLAGLGRLSAEDARRAAEATQVRIGGVNAWTQAIDRAGTSNQPGLVALLAAVGMQSPRWDQVTPEAVFHIVSAMRAAGMTNYARMIAIEAVTRAA